jgi:dephospho-CoA kinase
MIVLGLTGSIGMGKSTAAKLLAEQGIPVHDADAAVHVLLGPGGAAVAPVGALCPAALAEGKDGKPYINRKALGAAFFADPALKAEVEGVLFPLVKAEAEAFVEQKKKEGHAFALLDVPLLFEAGWDKFCDKTICVSAPLEVQRARVLARPGMTEERLQAVLAAQMPDAEKRARADYVVDTSKGFEDTRAQLTGIVDGLRPPKIAPRAPKPSGPR